tara:strand:+ start:2855 stop:3526 length:672 start_codon:yes stop_codon:yes gene_type:complete
MPRFATFSPGPIANWDWNKNFSEPTTLGSFSLGPDRGESLEIINGFLTNQMTTTSEDDPFVTNLMYRPQSLCDGHMVGQTANMDYPDLVFPGDSGEHNARQPVPGNCIDFYVPYDASVVVLQWRWSVTNTHPNKKYVAAKWAEGNEITTRCYFDGNLIGGLSRGILGGWDGYARINQSDRCYSMHHLKSTSTKKGWHSAELRFFCNKNTVRFRVRNVKVLWFK